MNRKRRMYDTQTVMKIANSAVMLILARSSSIIIVGLSIWILSNVSDMRVTLGIVGSQISGFDRRIESLEAWRNQTQKVNFIGPMKPAKI